MYWGIAVLIIVLIAAGGFMYWQWSSVQQLKEELAQDEKMLEGNEKPVAENKPPRPAREGYKWVPHGDHFHEVPLDAPDVWQEGTHQVPVAQTPKAPDLSADDTKPLGEDFFRDNYSKEQLASMIKSDKKVIEQLRTVNIPQLEESRKKLLKLLQLVPENPNTPNPRAERLAEIEAQIKQYKGVVERSEEMIETMSNVLNEEVTNNVEK